MLTPVHANRVFDVERRLLSGIICALCQGAAAFALLMLTTGCSVNVPVQELPGEYVLKAKNARVQLSLHSNFRYQQTVTYADGRKSTREGTWEYDPETGVTLVDPFGVQDEYVTAPVAAHLLPVTKLGGTIELDADPNLGTAYVKH